MFRIFLSLPKSISLLFYNFSHDFFPLFHITDLKKFEQLYDSYFSSVQNLRSLQKEKILYIEFLLEEKESLKILLLKIWRDNKSMKRIVISIFMIFLIIFGYIYYMGTQNESVEILSKYGSSGEEVKQIQQKLKEWGYYKGNVDGVYGSQTQQAVKNFQKANGLKQDGIAGEKTLSASFLTSLLPSLPLV